MEVLHGLTVLTAEYAAQRFAGPPAGRRQRTTVEPAPHERAGPPGGAAHRGAGAAEHQQHLQALVGPRREVPALGGLRGRGRAHRAGRSDADGAAGDPSRRAAGRHLGEPGHRASGARGPAVGGRRRGDPRRHRAAHPARGLRPAHPGDARPRRGPDGAASARRHRGPARRPAPGRLAPASSTSGSVTRSPSGPGHARSRPRARSPSLCCPSSGSRWSRPRRRPRYDGSPCR